MHLKKYAWGLIILLVLSAACQSPKEPTPSAQEIIDASIKAHGGDVYQDFAAAFTFRDKDYTIQKAGEAFTYTRTFAKEGDTLHDVLANGAFTRQINGQVTAVPDTMATKYANSVNSVAYFALLPAPLNDPAAKKQYLGQEAIKGINYHKIKVTFAEEGGGDDFDDVFIYWIHPENSHMDYLAYEYHVNGGGIRFRETINPREMGGIRWQDYVNYKAEVGKVALEDTGKAFEKGELKELSRILLENVKVK